MIFCILRHFTVVLTVKSEEAQEGKPLVQTESDRKRPLGFAALDNISESYKGHSGLLPYMSGQQTQDPYFKPSLYHLSFASTTSVTRNRCATAK